MTSNKQLHSSPWPEAGGGLRRGSLELLAEKVATYEKETSFPSFFDDPFGLLDRHTICTYTPRLLAALGAFCVGMYVNSFSQVLLQQRMSDYYNSHWEPTTPSTGPVKLWDLGHSLLPYINLAKVPVPVNLPGVLAFLSHILIAIRFWIVPGPMSLRWTIMCRWFLLLGILFLFRSITIAATVLPNPDNNCRPTATHPHSLWWEAGAVMLSWDHTCEDMLFSGHAVFITLSALFMVTYMPKAPWSASVMIDQYRWCSRFRALQLFCIAYPCVGYYSMIVSHTHYTADVFLGALVTYFVFAGYHHLIQIAPLHKSWIIVQVMMWFEGPAPDMWLGLQMASSRMQVMKQVDIDLSGELLQEATPSTIVANDLQHLIFSASIDTQEIPAGHASAAQMRSRSFSVDQVNEMVRVYDAGDTFPSFWTDPFGCKDLKLFCKYWPRFVFALLFWFGCMYVNGLSQSILQRDMASYYESHWKPIPPTKGSLKLWDLGHYLFPYLSAAKYPMLSPDTVASACCNFVVFRFGILAGPMTLRWTILCRWLLLFGVMFLFRAVSIIATALPNPDYTCKPRITYPENIWLEAMKVALRMDLTCQDVLYSGHTVAVTMATLFIAKYSVKSPWSPRLLISTGWCSWLGVLHILCIAYTVLGYYCIIASHFHFTVDVVVGALMSIFVFFSYHNAIEAAPLRMHHALSPYRLLLWFERPALDMRLWHKVAARRLEAMHQLDADLSCQILQETEPSLIATCGLKNVIKRTLSSLPPIREESETDEVVHTYAPMPLPRREATSPQESA